MTRMFLNVFCLVLLSAFNLPAQSASPGPADPNAAPPETFQVRNKKFTDLLRPEDASSADGTRIVLYPRQHWKCLTWSFHPAGESAFQLQNLYTSKTFAADSAENAKLFLKQVPFAKNPGERPTWKVVRLADGTVKITDAKSGKALTAVPGDHGTGVMLADWQDTDEQKWELLKIDPKTLTM
jgi:hypothetical protein